MGKISNIRSESRPIPFCMDGYIANYKADGSTGLGIAFAIVGYHENRPTDMTNLIVEEEDEDSNREEVR